jgi:hypothetical protein
VEHVGTPLPVQTSRASGAKEGLACG